MHLKVFGQMSLVVGHTAADIDGDGDIDLASGCSEVDEVVWYENIDGKGTFGVKKPYQHLLILYVLFLADIDGDGDTDLLSANSLFERSLMRT